MCLPVKKDLWKHERDFLSLTICFSLNSSAVFFFTKKKKNKE